MVKHSNLGVLTDLEPDDLIAIAALPQAAFYVVGESDPAVKWARMKRYVELLYSDPSQSKVIAGMPSDKIYEADGQEFYDGLSMPSDPRSSLDGRPMNLLDSKDDGLALLEGALRALRSCDKPTLIVLKPPRELIVLYQANPSAFKELVRPMHLLAYGGFNFRTLPSSSQDTLIDMFTFFSSVTLYDRSVSTERQLDLTGNTETLPGIHKVINAGSRRAHPLWTAVAAAIKDWNANIEARVRGNTCAHSRRIHEAIISDNMQVVLADIVIAAIYHLKAEKLPRMEINQIYSDAQNVLRYDHLTGPIEKRNWVLVRPLDPTLVDDTLAPILGHV